MKGDTIWAKYALIPPTINGRELAILSQIGEIVKSQYVSRIKPEHDMASGTGFYSQLAISLIRISDCLCK